MNIPFVIKSNVILRITLPKNVMKQNESIYGKQPDRSRGCR